MTIRYRELDGLRGLAALSVFMSHAIGLVVPERVPLYLSNSLFHVIYDGAAAVDFFFVLSGFCLALPYVGKEPKKIDFGEFWIRRFFRIYPTYLFGLVVALMLQVFLFRPTGLEGLSSWARGLWYSAPSLRDLLMHILFVGPWFDTKKIDPVIWSLVIEMRMSILLPVFLWLQQRFQAGAVSLGILTIVVALGLSVQALFFLPLFILGILIAQFCDGLLDWVRASPMWQRIIVWLLCLMGYSVRFSVPGWVPNSDGLWVHGVVGTASAVLLLLSLGAPGVRRVMAHPVVGFLGDISFSLYLLHLPILIVAASLVYPVTLSLPVTWIIALAVTLGVSYLSKRYVENISNQFGKTVAGHWVRCSQKWAASHQA